MYACIYTDLHMSLLASSFFMTEPICKLTRYLSAPPMIYWQQTIRQINFQQENTALGEWGQWLLTQLETKYCKYCHDQTANTNNDKTTNSDKNTNNDKNTNLIITANTNNEKNTNSIITTNTNHDKKYKY